VGALGIIGIHFKESLPAIIITTNTFVWYSLLSELFLNLTPDLNLSDIGKSITLALFYAGIACSAFVGAKIHARSTVLFFIFWLTTGITSTLLLIFLNITLSLGAFAVSFILGASIGVGIPACLAYFAEFTNAGNRGTLGGLIWGISGFLILALSVILSNLSTDYQFSILALWRAIGLISPVLIMKKAKTQERVVPSYSSLLTNSTLIRYLLPGIMFSLVNWIEGPIVRNLFGQDFFSSVVFIWFALVGIFAFVGGLFSDRIGRKPLIIIGFIILGVEYGLLGLFSNITVVWYIYICLDSAVWGMFASVLFMALWGDLAEQNSRERFYLLGWLPYLLAGYLSILVEPYVALIPVTAAFSLASFFLFLAVLPLIYARETLPEKKIRDRELKQYIEKAKKVKEKYA